MRIKNEEKKPLKWALGIAGFWLLFSLISLFFIPEYRLMFNGTVTIWTVTDIKEYYDDDDGTTYKPKVKYNCEWSQQENRHSSSSSSYHYRKWAQIKVYCDPNEPSNFLIKSRVNYMSFLFSIGGIAVLIFWIKILITEIRRIRLIKYLSQHGIHVNATVESIESPRYQSKGYQTKHFIVKATNWTKKYTDVVYSNISYIVKKWDTVEFLVDPFDANKYCINTDKLLEKNVDEECVKEFIKDSKTNNQSNSQVYSPTGVVMWDWNNYNNQSQWNWFATWFLWNILNNIWNSQNFANQLINTANVYDAERRELKKPLSSYTNETSRGTIIFLIIIGGGLGLVGIYLWLDANKLDISNFILAFIWCPFLLIWLLYLFKKKNKDKQIKNLKENWKQLDAIITEIRKSNVKINDQTWYNIVAISWSDIYESPRIYLNLYHYVKQWDHITIFVSFQNYSKYYMDLDSIHPGE